MKVEALIDALRFEIVLGPEAYIGINTFVPYASIPDKAAMKLYIS